MPPHGLENGMPSPSLRQSQEVLMMKSISTTQQFQAGLLHMENSMKSLISLLYLCTINLETGKSYIILTSKYDLFEISEIDI